MKEMTRIEKSIEIEAPVEKVFNFAADWQNKSKWYAGIHDWKPTTEKTRGVGARFVFKTKFLGREDETEMETDNFAQNESIGYKSVRGVESRHKMLFASLGGRTKVTDISEYTLPIPVLGWLVDALVFKRRMHRNSEDSLQNLKRLTGG